MTQRRMLEERLASLRESGEIIRSMKNLAFMETHKLSRLIGQQREVVREIEAVANDFLSFNADALPPAVPTYRLYLVIGSRRGFCGDFNERLATFLHHVLREADDRQTALIAVGQRLGRRLAADFELAAELVGADVAEEVPVVLRAIVGELENQRNRHGALHLSVLYQQAARSEPTIVPLLPPFEGQRNARPQYPFAPLLNLPPRVFLLELGEQYLFAALHAVLYESLLQENERRVRHLEGAVHHLDESTASIQRRAQALRQEEIIEEIEVILLNAGQTGMPGEEQG